MVIRPFAAAISRSAVALPCLAIAVALLLMIAPAAQALGAALTASPAGQSVGGTVTLSGSGYLPSTPITFTFDGNPIATSPSSVTSGPGGGFSGVKMTIPSGTSPGSHSIAASDGVSTATTTVNVDSLLASPAGQSRGGTVTLSGSGFTPNTQINLLFSGTTISTTTSDGTGSFSGVQITIPSAASIGSHMLTATDADNEIARLPFSVDSISVSPRSGAQDNSLSVTGAGWPAGDTVQAQIDGSTVCQLLANAQGAISGDQSNGCRVPPDLAPGSYSVTATDLTNGSSQATGNSFTILSAPSAAFTGPSSASPGTAVTFNGSASRAPSQITSYDWSWGDGTADAVGSSATATHSYATAGTYIVALTITDSTGQTGSVSHTVSIEGPPTASFSATPATAPTGNPISFDGTGSSDPNGTIKQYSWEFGDGASSTQPTPSHAYAQAGTYTVTLKVTDAVKAVQSVSQTITITDRPPLAEFTPTAATVLAGSNVPFDGTASSDPDGAITSYSWNFGDGKTSTSSQPGHTYMQTGTFTVSLTVTDNAGNTASVSHQVTVIAPPPLQTLILTPLAPPALVKAGPASTTTSGLAKLGQRLFCPGPGVGCKLTIIASSRAVRPVGAKSSSARPLRIGRAHLAIPANASAALRFRLSKLARSYLSQHGRLPVSVTIIVTRASLTAKRVQSLTLRG